MQKWLTLAKSAVSRVRIHNFITPPEGMARQARRQGRGSDRRAHRQGGGPEGSA